MSIFRRVVGLIAGITLGVSAQSPLVIQFPLPVSACGPWVLAVADFDTSGFPDFLVDAGTAGGAALGVVHDPVTVGGGGCTPAPIPTVSPSSLRAIPARLNGDAHLDAIVYAISPNRIVDAYGNGAGGFTYPGTGPYFAAPAGSGSVIPKAVWDFDQDGRDDVVVYHQGVSFGTIELFLNLPSGWTMSWSHTLTASVVPGGSTESQFVVGDVDGNGAVDLVWVENVSNAGRLRIATWSGAGAFTVSPTFLQLGFGNILLHAISDLDGDGRDDVVIASPFILASSPIAIVFGVAPGSTATVTSVPTPVDAIFKIMPIDFDRDGIRDLVYEGLFSASSTRPVQMLRGLGAGQYTTPIVFATEANPGLFSAIRHFAADMDGDHDLDLVRAELSMSSGNVIKLFHNQSIYATGCSGFGGMPPSSSVGLATPGNAAFAIGVSGALPNSPAVLGVSLARVPTFLGCGIALNLGLSFMMLPTDALGITMTDAAGSASINLPLAPGPGLAGLAAYAQWGVVDMQSAFMFAGQPFAVSDARTILAW